MGNWQRPACARTSPVAAVASWAACFWPALPRRRGLHCSLGCQVSARLMRRRVCRLWHSRHRHFNQCLPGHLWRTWSQYHRMASQSVSCPSALGEMIQSRAIDWGAAFACSHCLRHAPPWWGTRDMLMTAADFSMFPMNLCLGREHTVWSGVPGIGALERGTPLRTSRYTGAALLPSPRVSARLQTTSVCSHIRAWCISTTCTTFRT
mmetsp:Transcript_2576/g.4940  ORF Transcript_2576/g.4940 Transcript_2576/m.4940 type:complete len:207 (+) Transcript_2576:566-1186(+)